MKKIFDKKVLFGFVLGLIVMSGISVFGINYLYHSEDVSYNGKSVKEALDELYSNSNNGKIKTMVFPMIDIPRGTNSEVIYSLNVSEYLPEDYKNLTIDNFGFNQTIARTDQQGMQWSADATWSFQNYDNTTGILIVHFLRNRTQTVNYGNCIVKCYY